MAARKPAKKPTRKKTKRKSSSSSSAKSASKKTARKKTTPSASQTVSLRTDLGKYDSEEYASTELLRGAMVLVEREGADVIRSALMAVLAGKVPLAGAQLAKQSVDSIIRQFTDDYKKLSTDDRKAVRGVLRWLSGDFEVDTRTTSELMTALSTPSSSIAEATPAHPAASTQLEALASGFVLPPKPSTE